MDYMREINAFYDWLATNPVSDSARNLWHALMHTANRAGWIPEFAVAVSVLEAKTGMSRSAIYRARNILKETGRITFRNRDGNQASIYSIVSFVCHTDTQSGTHTEAQTEHKPQRKRNTKRNHNTSYPSDTRKTKTKTKTKTNNEGPAPSADASVDDPPDGGMVGRVPPDEPKKTGDAALIRQAVERFTVDTDLRKALHGWIEMRKKARKPLTPHAIDLALKKLASLSEETRTPMIDLVNEATMRGWQGFYPIPENGGKRNAEYVKPDERPAPKLSGITRF